MNYLDNVVQKVARWWARPSARVEVDATQSVTIARPRDEVTQFWRDPQSLSASSTRPRKFERAMLPGSMSGARSVHPTTPSRGARPSERTSGFRFTTTGGRDRPDPRIRPGLPGRAPRLSPMSRCEPGPRYRSSCRRSRFRSPYVARSAADREVPTRRDNPRPAVVGMIDNRGGGPVRALCWNGVTTWPWKPSTIRVWSILTTRSSRYA